MANIGVIGSGTWGTALAVLLVQNGCQATLWSAFEDEAKVLCTARKHPNLPDAVIPQQMEITTDLKKAMEDKDILVLAVPSIFVRQTAAKMASHCREEMGISFASRDQPVMSTMSPFLFFGGLTG